MFKDTKERLSKRTGIKGKQFEKIKLAVVFHNNFSRPEYLNDGKSSSNCSYGIILTNKQMMSFPTSSLQIRTTSV